MGLHVGFVSTKAIGTLYIPVEAVLRIDVRLSGKVFPTAEYFECVLAPSMVPERTCGTWSIRTVQELCKRSAMCAKNWKSRYKLNVMGCSHISLFLDRWLTLVRTLRRYS